MNMKVIGNHSTGFGNRDVIHLPKKIIHSGVHSAEGDYEDSQEMGLPTLRQITKNTEGET